jgi:hypothetical protein
MKHEAEGARARSAEIEKAGFDDGAAEGPREFGETLTVGVTQGGVGGKGQTVRASEPPTPSLSRHA